MDKKDQEKSKAFRLKVIKSGQEEATSSSTSGSSFTGAAAEGAWSSTKTGGAWSSSGAAGGGTWASSERAVPPAWPSRTPYKSVPQKSGSESWKSSSTTGAGGGGHGHLLKLGEHGHLLKLGEHGHLPGLRAEEHGLLPSEPCRLLGHHGPRTSPSHKNQGQSGGRAHLHRNRRRGNMVIY